MITKSKMKKIAYTTLTLGIISGFAGRGVIAAEVDNYSMQDYHGSNAEDVTDSLNAYVDRGLLQAIGSYNAKVLEGKEFKNPEDTLTKMFYRKFERTPLISFTRLWVEANLPHFKAQKNHIYNGMSFFGGPILKVYGIVGNVTVNEIPIGLDKLGHFLDGGYAIFQKVQYRGQSEEQALRWSINTEASILGKTSTGVFSNGDLVANYEGYIFYKSITQDNVIEGKESLVKFENGLARLNRSFDWRDHVNEYFNEAMAPSDFSRSLDRHVKEQLLELCELFSQRPELYTVDPERDRELKNRYQKLGLKIHHENRMGNVCLRNGLLN
jgi:hypothetical protein